jgi:hypothetical protein
MNDNENIIELDKRNGQLRWKIDTPFTPCEIVKCACIVRCRECPLEKYKLEDLTLVQIMDILKTKLGEPV